MTIKPILLLTLVAILFSCSKEETIVEFGYQNAFDRTWLGEEWLAVPLESWRVNDGRIEVVGDQEKVRANLLTQSVGEGEQFSVALDMGVISGQKGFAGLRFGIQDETDAGVKSLSYYGKGIDTGISLGQNPDEASGTESAAANFVLGTKNVQIPADFDLSHFSLKFKGKSGEIVAIITDQNGLKVSLNKTIDRSITGMLALVNTAEGDVPNPLRCWFDDIALNGPSVEDHSEDAFGPILFSMYTLSRQTLRMTAQLPPLGEKEGQEVELQIQSYGGDFETVDKTPIDPAAKIAVFEVNDWDDSRDWPYRLTYTNTNRNGVASTNYYEGTIRKDPGSAPLRVAGMTCQHWNAYPYGPIVDHLTDQNPDLLYFSGDQIYESNGGYGIERQDAQLAITNYLGKWFMFGWAFGDVMRDRPTIVITDDHEVYQGNLWGEGGETVSTEKWNRNMDSRSGYVQPLEMIDVVIRTNTSHLPLPSDPTPMKNDIPVYYTDLVYGEVSFAMVSDRAFKSGPERVAWWEGRKDHVRDESVEADRLERDNLVMLGDRQLNFLNDWASNWSGAKMKCFLSQTIFGNAATHHGTGQPKGYLIADLDSGGWPKGRRDVAVETIRKSGAFHICGDQHLPLMVQYGLKESRDAGWVFCTPAISVGYQRRFWADKLERPIVDRPKHGLPNTGAYEDFFGNHLFVQAVASPPMDVRRKNRYESAALKTSGYGLITFDKSARTIESHCIPFATPVGEMADFPGWPVVVDQADNYGRGTKALLPQIIVSGTDDPVYEVRKDGQLVYSFRPGEQTFQPFADRPGSYTLVVGDPNSDQWVELPGLNTSNSSEIFKVDLN